MPRPDLLRVLGLKYPIIQAPMAGTSTPLLAAAVSNYGGLGSLGLGASTAKVARESIMELQRLLEPGRPFHVNLFVHRPLPSLQALSSAELEERKRGEEKWIAKLSSAFREVGAEPPKELRTIYTSFAQDSTDEGGGGEMLDVLLETKPPVISFHFGLPSSTTIAKLRDTGAVLLATATNVSEARAIEEAGLDGIIAQGIEAGGHRGIFDRLTPDPALGIMALTRLLVARDTLPIIAAGAIMDGAGIRAVLELGAVAAQLGTAFIGCPESSADRGHREALSPASDAAYATILTDVVSGRPARALPNKFTDLMHRHPATTNSSGEEILLTPAYPRAYDVAKALHAAAKQKGDYGYGPYWAGQAAPLARHMPAEELMRALVEELGDVGVAI